MLISFKKILSLILKIEKTTLFISGLSILLMMLLVTLDVIFRNLFSFSIPGSYEISEKYLMPLVIFPILFFVYKSDSLPKLEFVVLKLKGKIRYSIQIILSVVEIVAFLALTLFGWQKAIEGTRELLSFPAAGNMYPLYPFLFLVPIGFGLLTVGVILKLITTLHSDKSHDNKLLNDGDKYFSNIN